MAPPITSSACAEETPEEVAAYYATHRERAAAKKAHQDEAEARARGLLVAAIGEGAVKDLEDGGTYIVPSRRWPGTEYHIPAKGYIKVVRGGLWQDVCLVSSDASLPWPDVVLSRIKMIQANETIVQAKGNKQGSGRTSALDRIVRILEGRRQ